MLFQSLFCPEQVAAALTAALEQVVEDPDNPRTQPGDWDNAIVSHSYEESREKLTERRKRSLQKAPRKEQVVIRFSPEVLGLLPRHG